MGRRGRKAMERKLPALGLQWLVLEAFGAINIME